MNQRIAAVSGAISTTPTPALMRVDDIPLGRRFRFLGDTATYVRLEDGEEGLYTAIEEATGRPAYIVPSLEVMPLPDRQLRH